MDDKGKRAMPEKTILEHWGPVSAAILALLPAPLLARILYHRRLVRLGHRRMWSWELAWELPTAALCAVLAGGLAQWMELPLLATHAMAGVVGWLGPRGLEVMASKHFKVDPTETLRTEDPSEEKKPEQTT